MTLKPLLSGLCLLFLVACAPVTMPPVGTREEIQRETAYERNLAFKSRVEDQNRVYNVSFPLLAANAEFCYDNVVPSMGMTFWNLEILQQELHQSVADAYNVHAVLAVRTVAHRSPAERAGIRPGDLVISVNGEEIPHGYAARKAIRKAVEMNGDKQAQFVIERNGKVKDVVVQPEMICNFPVVLNLNNPEINAYADGEKIVVYKGMLRFVRNDNDLALVLAHELGHSVMKHPLKGQGNALLGGIGGVALDAMLGTGDAFTQFGQDMGALAYSVGFEQEADYVGMYFMERAGFNSAHVAEHWRRFATEVPRSLKSRVTHPTSPERFLSIERAHHEIALKKAKGQPLIPNFKK